MPVANAVPRTALARVNAVSSTPIAVAAAPGHARCNNGSPWSRTAAITVAQPTPNSRATAATACPSRPTRRQAWARARSVHDARGAIAGCVSVQVCCSHWGCTHRQMRLTHTSVTRRSPAGKSRTHVGRRSCNRAIAPHTGHQPIAAVVSIAYSSSPSCSDTASTAMPSSPSITVALLLLFTWGLSIRVH